MAQRPCSSEQWCCLLVTQHQDKILQSIFSLILSKIVVMLVPFVVHHFVCNFEFLYEYEFIVNYLNFVQSIECRTD